MILGFDVEGQFVTRSDDERVVNRSVNYLELCFNFKDTETWDDLTKRVLFKGDGETYCKQLDNENKVVVPSEVLTGDSFVFSLYGVTVDLMVRVTCNLMKIIMVSSGFTGDSLVSGSGNRSVVDDVYARLDGLDVTVTGHTTVLSNLGDDVDSLESTVNGIGDDITAINGKLDNTVEMTVEYPDGSSETFDVVVK